MRDVLAPGEETTLTDTGQQGLFLVTAGMFQTGVAGAPESLTQGAGEASTFRGELTITNTGTEDAVFAAAMIGNQAPLQRGGSPPTGTSAPLVSTPATTASLAITALNCPLGYDGDDFRTDCPEPLAGITFYLETEGSSELIEAVSDASGAAAYDDLTPGTVRLSSGINANAGTIFPRCTDESGADAALTDVSGGYAYTLDLVAGSAVGCDWFLIPRERTGGTIGATLATCPEGMIAESFNPAACAVTGSEDLPGLDLSLTSVDGSVQLSLDDAEPAGPSRIFSWDSLPFGLYALDVTAIPNGYDSYLLQLDGGPACEVPTAACSAPLNENAAGAAFVVYFFPAVNAEPIDTDGNGLSDEDEAALGADPANPDSDGDGLLDGEESGPDATSPLDPDSDDDGLSDFEELRVHGTIPTIADSDFDGVDDSDEIANGTDPFDPNDL